MLSPHDRTSLFEALRPPEGFALDAAAGTSFSLDLEALLTAPIAFALHEASRAAEPGEGGAEPVGLLEAIRRHAGRITLFCQGGQIALPTRRRTVFAWLEDAVVEVAAPRQGRLFHPKVWVARYQALDGDARVLRVLCATRNLTFDPSWDTLLRVDSAPYAPDPVRPEVPGQALLAELLRRLPELAHRRPDEARAVVVADLADELARVPMIAPEPFASLDFHVIGLDGTSSPPFPERSRRALVISPFLGEGFLEQLTTDHHVAALVSREESLDRLPAATLGSVDRVAVLHPAVDSEPVEATGEPVPAAGDASVERQPVVEDEHGDPGRRLAGLHAKLFVFDTDEGTRLFTGSANATAAAFDGNVEVLAELRGPASTGVGAVLTDTPGETGLADLLVDYRPREEPVAADDADELDWRLDGVRRDLAAMTLVATVTADGDDHVLAVTSDEPLPAPAFEDLELRLWPVTLDEASSAQPLVPAGPPPPGSPSPSRASLRSSGFAPPLATGPPGSRRPSSSTPH